MDMSPSQNKKKNAKQIIRIEVIANQQCEALIKKGDECFLAAKYEEAIFNYHKALEINPNMEVTLFNLGKIYFKIADYQKSIEAFVKACELVPNNVTVLRFLATAYCNGGDMYMCIVTYQKCLKLQPDDLEINVELALIYLHNVHNLQAAEKYFKKCIQLNAERVDLYKNLLQIYQELSKHKDAFNICMILGDLYLKKSDPDNAKTTFTSALSLNPNNAGAHWKLGLALHLLGNYDLAIIWYKKANELIPDFVHPSSDSTVNGKQ
ncbi:hypothetical protein AGLY_012666 [Aphis glycines]|uniref:Cell division cycle protein 27 homolog n=1 Tax=Aphis glycines TaxID=307491 RepID=A0A6G0T957_APHGL|nr:hypothetical protein AGLY_012666 [Aphis glycines]